MTGGTGGREDVAQQDCAIGHDPVRDPVPREQVQTRSFEKPAQFQACGDGRNHPGRAFMAKIGKQRALHRTTRIGV